MKYMEKRKQIISIGQEIYRQRLVAGTWEMSAVAWQPAIIY